MNKTFEGFDLGKKVHNTIEAVERNRNAIVATLIILSVGAGITKYVEYTANQYSALLNQTSNSDENNTKFLLSAESPVALDYNDAFSNLEPIIIDHYLLSKKESELVNSINDKILAVQSIWEKDGTVWNRANTLQFIKENKLNIGKLLSNDPATSLYGIMYKQDKASIINQPLEKREELSVGLDIGKN
jgi:hypothetical protein